MAIFLGHDRIFQDKAPRSTPPSPSTSCRFREVPGIRIVATARRLGHFRVLLHFFVEFPLSRTLVDLGHTSVIAGHTSVIFLDSMVGAMMYNRMN